MGGDRSAGYFTVRIFLDANHLKGYAGVLKPLSIWR